MKLLRQGILFACLTLLLAAPTIINAVVINEVQIKPDQYVEIVNSASQSADISGWYIDDSGGTSFFTIPDNSVLQPMSCAVFTYSFYFNSASPDTVRLFSSRAPPTSSSAQLIDSLSYTTAPDAGFSLQRIPDFSDTIIATSSSIGLWNNTGAQCTISPTPTPTHTPTPLPSPTPTIAPTQPPTPTSIPPISTPTPVIQNIAIELSEIQPNPSEGNEWVELYNPNNFTAYLSNWYIDDVENAGASPFKFSITIEPYSYAVVYLPKTMLNNSGDSVRLLNSNKQAVSIMEYQTIDSKNTISFVNNSWCQTIPSPNTPNNPCINADTTVPSTSASIGKNGILQNSTFPTPIYRKKRILNTPHKPIAIPRITVRLLRYKEKKEQTVKPEVLGISTQKYIKNKNITYTNLITSLFLLQAILSLASIVYFIITEPKSFAILFMLARRYI